MKPSELYQQRKQELSLQDDAIQDATVQCYDQLQSLLKQEIKYQRSILFTRKKKSARKHSRYVYMGWCR